MMLKNLQGKKMTSWGTGEKDDSVTPVFSPMVLKKTKIKRVKWMTPKMPL